MAGYKNIGTNDYIKRYGWKYGFLRALFMTCPIHIVKDYENKKILYYAKVANILKKKYLKTASIDPVGLEFASVEVDNPIWIFWKQGIDQAPELVKKCIESVKHNAETEVIVLTEKNINHYIKFPSYIEEKYSKGDISTAAYSDLLRFSLLEHFGGTWIDSTVYLTGKLPEYIVRSELFAYQDAFGLMQNAALISNWLLHSKPHKEVMRETRNMTFEYWRTETHVMEYLFTYIFLTIVFNEHADALASMPYANSDYSHWMLDHINNIYDENMTKHMLELTSVHKLSYKLKDEAFQEKDSLYHKIIEDKI